ncbi:hypothetical protein [Armatimonas sp.]|uniref:hypothetical protein n=1 Tax=Armatimonas sp. TaxID=1872638 RepID=UPI003753E4CA
MIVFGGTGRNLSPPPDTARRACWELQGEWGNFLGTPIAARWFVTAAHVGGQLGDVFVLAGRRYAAVAHEKIPGTDTALWRVDRDFPRWATLCEGDEQGWELFIVGRGTARGSELLGKGWRWGPIDHKKSWGMNRVGGFLKSKPYGELLLATFDKNAGPDEATLSDGDSGGGVFLKGRNGKWRLAGLNHDINPGDDGVDRFYSTTGRKDDLFRAALYDGRGLFLGPPDALKPVTGERSRPTVVAAQRLSAYRAEIARILAHPDRAYPDHAPLLQTRWGQRGSVALAGAVGVTVVALLHQKRR